MLFASLFGTLGSIVGQWPVLSTLVLLVLVIVLSYYALRPRNLPPGPWGIPWVGSPHLLTDHVHHDLNNLSKVYGEIFTLMMSLRPLIVLNSNRLIREAFVKRAEEFANRPIMYDLDYMDLFDELFNRGYSAQWRERKKVMVRILRGAGFGSSLVEDIFPNNLDKMFSNINHKSVNLKRPLQKVLAMTQGKVVYGASYEYNDKELEELVTLAVEWMASIYREGMALGYWSDNVPFSITKVLTPGMMNSMKTSNHAFQKFLIKKIHAHRQTFDKDHPKGDVIDGYLRERGDDPELTDNAFASTILMLFPDGIDSTGSLLQFITLYLTYYPEWQRKVQAQIDEVCGSRRPTLADRPNLPLVEATIYESGRLSSVVCLTIAHCPMENTTLCGYNIPKDSYILANIWAAHMDKEIFPQGDAFAPETLLDANGKFVRNEKIMMFSAGRRMCIGEQMVKNEAFLYVTQTLQRFSLKFPDGQPLPSLASIGGLIREPLPFNVCFVPRESH